MNKFTTAVLTLVVPGLLAGAMPAAAATSYDHAPTTATAVAGAEAAWNDHGRQRGYRDRYRGSYGRGSYDNRGSRYDRQARYDRDNRNTWRGNDGRYYCRRDNGTTGLLIGGAVGGVAGHEIAGRGDRTLGTILGVAGGALLGRAIDKGNSRCR